MKYTERYHRQKLINQEITALVVLGIVGFFVGTIFLGMLGFFIDIALVAIGGISIWKKWKEMTKFIKKLTKAQEKAMPAYRDKWIEIGLRIGETDWKTFDKYMPICYEKAELKYPKNIVRVQSPLVGALASSVAESILKLKRRGAVDDAVGVAVRDAVGGAVGGAVETTISIAKKAGITLSWHYWLGGQFWVGGWYWGIAFVNFFFDICKLKLSKDIMDRALAYRKVCESVNYIWPNRDFVMVCARPVHIDRDESGRLHSESRMAIMYPDGWGLYMYHGVKVTKKIIETPDKLIKKDWLEEKNLEVRRIIQERMGERFINELDPKLINEHEDKRIGKVLEINIDPDPEKVARYLCAKDWSTDRVYYLRIPPTINDTLEAQAWTYSNNDHTFTAKDMIGVFYGKWVRT